MCVYKHMELVWRNGNVMNCHLTAWGSIPGGSGVKPSLTSFARGLSSGHRTMLKLSCS